MPGYASAWTFPADTKRTKKETAIARQNKRWIENGGPTYVGRPAGPKAKGHKTPATRTLPYLRSSANPFPYGKKPKRAN